MSEIKAEKLREKIDRFLSNYICSACDNSAVIEHLKTASYEELLRIAKKYGIETEDSQWTK